MNLSDPYVRAAFADLAKTFSRMKGHEARALRIGGTPATEATPTSNLSTAGGFSQQEPSVSQEQV